MGMDGGRCDQLSLERVTWLIVLSKSSKALFSSQNFFYSTSYIESLDTCMKY